MRRPSTYLLVAAILCLLLTIGYPSPKGEDKEPVIQKGDFIVYRVLSVKDGELSVEPVLLKQAWAEMTKKFSSKL